MERITIEVDRRWAKLVQSPFYWVIAALTGVSVSFCPLFLYQFGREGTEFTDWRVLLCFAVTFLVPVVHFRLSRLVIQQLRTRTGERSA